MGSALRDNDLLSSSAIANATTGDALLVALYCATANNGIVLTVHAWEKIDALEDEEVLRHLLALALAEKKEVRFREWRNYTMEHPRLWYALAGKPTPETTFGA